MLDDEQRLLVINVPKVTFYPEPLGRTGCSYHSVGRSQEGMLGWTAVRSGSPNDISGLCLPVPRRCPQAPAEAPEDRTVGVTDSDRALSTRHGENCIDAWSFPVH